MSSRCYSLVVLGELLSSCERSYKVFFEEKEAPETKPCKVEAHETNRSEIKVTASGVDSCVDQ
eukprot:scaffold4229_cov38-Cyclotella_meneghiniana.AAC.10